MSTTASKRFLTEAETIDLMLSEATRWFVPWADSAFLCIDDARPRFEGCDDAFRDWAVDFVGQMSLALIGKAEHLAASIGASPDQKRRFVAACVGTYLVRLDELLSTPMQRGSA